MHEIFLQSQDKRLAIMKCFINSFLVLLIIFDNQHCCSLASLSPIFLKGAARKYLPAPISADNLMMEKRDAGKIVKDYHLPWPLSLFLVSGSPDFKTIDTMKPACYRMQCLRRPTLRDIRLSFRNVN